MISWVDAIGIIFFLSESSILNDVRMPSQIGLGELVVLGANRKILVVYLALLRRKEHKIGNSFLHRYDV